MSITLRVRDDVSLANLRKKSWEQTVLKTPHIGNMSPNNLLAAQCGFPCIFVDTTTPARDHNANPGLCIKGGLGHQLIHASTEHSLSTHVKVFSRHMAPFGFESNTWVGEGHLSQARSIFPNTHIESGMDYYARHIELTLDILRAGTNAYPGVWYRRIDDTGAMIVDVKNGCPLSASNGITNWADVKDQVFLPNHNEGWVIPNLLAITIDTVIQSHEDGPEIWFLSGPDMIKYLPKQVGALSALYDAIREATGCAHEHVEIQLVPFTHFRFAVRQAQAESLKRLLHGVAQWPNKRGRLTELAVACSDLWYRTERRNHFSQHDMNPGETLYVPENLSRLPLSEVNALWETIRKTYLPKEYR